MIASLTDRHKTQQIRSRDSGQLSSECGVGLRPVPCDPPPLPALHLVAPEGQLQVHTAPYRGSFSSVLSQAVRTAGLGSRVLISQFLKGGVQQGPSGCVQLCGGLIWLRPDVPACVAEPNLDGCREAVQAVWTVCREHLVLGDLDQLVLDEIGLAIGLGYIDEAEVVSALEQRPGSMDVIITGPAIPANVVAMADQVTELRRGF
jgi:cob(I)alamin adenosyltransferase